MKWTWPSVIPVQRKHLLEQPVEEEPSIWIFGYGSLIWNPGFEYQEARKATVNGFARRFWQGNTTYRGTEVLPGRVATIVPSKSEDTLGMVFRVTGLKAIAEALDHLHMREIESGYVYQIVSADVSSSEQTSDSPQINDSADSRRTSRDTQSFQDDSVKLPKRIIALTYVAKTDNTWFLGPTESLTDMANEIARAKGKAGPNSDYLFNLAKSMRTHFPEHTDHHLFELESLVLQYQSVRS